MHFANNRFTLEKFPPPPPLLHPINQDHHGLLRALELLTKVASHVASALQKERSMAPRGGKCGSSVLVIVVTAALSYLLANLYAAINQNHALTSRMHKVIKTLASIKVCVACTLCPALPQHAHTDVHRVSFLRALFCLFVPSMRWFVQLEATAFEDQKGGLRGVTQGVLAIQSVPVTNQPRTEALHPKGSTILPIFLKKKPSILRKTSFCILSTHDHTCACILRRTCIHMQSGSQHA